MKTGENNAGLDNDCGVSLSRVKIMLDLTIIKNNNPATQPAEQLQLIIATVMELK